MKTYVITDIHGHYDLLNLALTNIERREPGKIVFTGDYVDRGPQSRQVIERLMAGPPDGWEWKILAGNHDLWFLDVIRFNEHPSEWLTDCGGINTLRSYGFQKDTLQIDRRMVPKEHLDWIDTLPLYHLTDTHVFVHACLDLTKTMKEQSEGMLTWGYWNGVDLPYGNRHIIHGHDSDPNGPLLLQNRTNLDCRTIQTGKLCVGVFEGPGGPKEVMEIKL